MSIGHWRKRWRTLLHGTQGIAGHLSRVCVRISKEVQDPAPNACQTNNIGHVMQCASDADKRPCSVCSVDSFATRCRLPVLTVIFIFVELTVVCCNLEQAARTECVRPCPVCIAVQHSVKNGQFSIICTVHEYPPWQQLFPFVALCHADVTLYALCVDEGLLIVVGLTAVTGLLQFGADFLH